MVNYKVYQSNSLDPRVNLSLEEYYMNTVKDDECIVLFWQSENAVVIGVNQNPYQECNLVNLERDHVVMVRRLSGGGAVYHDLGNLNFAFIAKTDNFSIDHNFRIILKALKGLGVEGVFNGRNDLTTLGRKFSGNAFIHEENTHLHHGTLLLNADITKISDYLTVSHKKLDNKGFDSIRSRVINLSEINPSIRPATVIQLTVEALKSEGIPVAHKEINIDELSSDVYKEKYMSHQWNYGECAAFEIKVEEMFDWGMVSLEMNISSGDIAEINISTDAMDYEQFSKLNHTLKDIKLTEQNVSEIIDKICSEDSVKQDLERLFKIHIFS